MSSNLAIGVIGLPDLVSVLKGTDVDILTPDVSARAVAAAAKEAAAAGRPYAIVVGPHDEKTLGWIEAQVASQKRRVLFVDGEWPSFGDVPRTKRVALPAGVDSIMAPFGLTDPEGRPLGGLPDDEMLTDGTIPAATPPVLVDDLDDDLWDTDVEPVAPPAFPVERPMPPPPPVDVAEEPPAQEPVAPVMPQPVQPVPVVPVAPAAPPPATPAPVPTQEPVAPVMPQPVQPVPVVPVAPAAPPPATPAPVPTQEPVAQESVAPVGPAGPLPEPAGAWSRPAPAPIPDTVPGWGESALGTVAEVPVLSTTGAATAAWSGRGSGTTTVVAFAGKGGVGKTSVAIALACRAVSVGGFRKVVLIDANRGQADVREYLGLANAELPSVYDVTMGASPQSVIVTPDRLRAARPAGLPDLGIAVVLGPRANQVSPVTPDTYRQVLIAAQEVAELVVVDTQIVEAEDTSGIIDQIVIPMLTLPKSWGVALSDSSLPSVKNALTRIAAFRNAGVPPDRLLWLFNRIVDTAGLDMAALASLISSRATLIDSVAEDANVVRDLNSGLPPSNASALASAVDVALHRITGRASFVRITGDQITAERAPRRRLFGRRGSA